MCGTRTHITAEPLSCLSAFAPQVATDPMGPRFTHNVRLLGSASMSERVTSINSFSTKAQKGGSGTWDFGPMEIVGLVAEIAVASTQRPKFTVLAGVGLMNRRIGPPTFN